MSPYFLLSGLKAKWDETLAWLRFRRLLYAESNPPRAFILFYADAVWECDELEARRWWTRLTAFDRATFRVFYVDEVARRERSREL